MSARKYPRTVLVAVIGVLAAFAFTTSASAGYPPGSTASLSANASAVSPGGGVTVSGSHFKGLVTFEVGGITIDRVTAGANGTFSANITLPAGQFPAGTYTITATDAFGDKQTITVTVLAAAAVPGNPSSGSSGLPNTGFAVLGIGGLGVLLLLGGGFMLLAGRRRTATV